MPGVRFREERLYAAAQIVEDPSGTNGKVRKDRGVSIWRERMEYKGHIAPESVDLPLRCVPGEPGLLVGGLDPNAEAGIVPKPPLHMDPCDPAGSGSDRSCSASTGKFGVRVQVPD
jgi:hypothetical protein